MNNFATSKTFIGLMLFGVRAIVTCAQQFGVSINPDQEIAIMNLATFVIAIFALSAGHVDALNAMPPGISSMVESSVTPAISEVKTALTPSHTVSVGII